jgi:SAM-dependent methyltransferase
MSDPLELTSRAEATHFWFRGFRGFVTPVLDLLSEGRHDLRIIDCGCGTGHNIHLLRRYGRVVGFDLHGGGVAMARASGAAVVRADAVQAPFTSGSFDIATSFDVVQCVEPDAAVVREMARMVRPGGAVVITMAALEMLRGDHSESWQEVRRYTPAMARALVTQAGLQVEQVTFLFGSLFPLMFSVRFVQRLLRPFRAHRPEGDIAVPSPPLNGLLTALVLAEARMARYVSLPVGSSLLVVGRKPLSNTTTPNLQLPISKR